VEGAKMAIPLEGRRELVEEPSRPTWNSIFELGLRLLPLLTAALPGTLIVAYSYALGYSDYYRIPMEFIRVSPMQAVIPFAWAYLIIQMLLRFAHQVQMFGPWPAIRKNLARVRGGYLLLLAAFGVAGWVRGEFPWSSVIAGVALTYFLLWSLPAVLRLASRSMGRRSTGAEPFVRRRIGLAMDAIWQHIFGRAPVLRGSRVSRWSVAESVLVIACGLLVALPYFMGVGMARIQAVYGVVGQSTRQASGGKDVIVTVYGDKVFIAHVEGRTMRSVEVRNFSELKDVEVRRTEIGRLHW
jgi:hypothetical protein